MLESVLLDSVGESPQALFDLFKIVLTYVSQVVQKGEVIAALCRPSHVEEEVVNRARFKLSHHLEPDFVKIYECLFRALVHDHGNFLFAQTRIHF